MPKYTTIYGSERTNLMYALIGTILSAGSIRVNELAEKFALSYDEIEKAVRTIGVTETGGSLDDHPFRVNYDQLEAGIVELDDYPLDLQVPRLSARQAAAISAGLRYLISVPGFAMADEAAQLLSLMQLASSGESSKAIDFEVGAIDQDVAILRKAISEGRAISCHYINGANVKSQRTMDPLRLESRDPVWYLRAYCHNNQKVLAFRLDRMDATTILDQSISDAAKVAEISDEIYVANDTDHIVTVDVEPEAYALISDFNAHDPSSKKSGTKRVTIKVRDLNVLGPVIAGYGGFATVIAPVEAKIQVRNFALAALGESFEIDGVDA